MKKLFISQPMRGKTDEEILAVREKAIKSAEKQVGEPVEVIDSFFQSAPVDAKPLWYLGESLKLLAEADVAFSLKDGTKPEDARLRILVLSNMALRPLSKIIRRVKDGGIIYKCNSDSGSNQRSGVLRICNHTGD